MITSAQLKKIQNLLGSQAPQDLWPTGEKLAKVNISKTFTVKEMKEFLEKQQKSSDMPNMYPTQAFLKEHYEITKPYEHLINFYKSSGFWTVNAYYKTGRCMGVSKRLKENIRVLFKLDTLPTTEEFWRFFKKAMTELYRKLKPLNHDIILYRGIYHGTIGQNFFNGKCIKSSQYPVDLAHRYCKPEEINGIRYFKGYKSTDNVKDYVYETLGFVSTGTKFSTAAKFSNMRVAGAGAGAGAKGTLSCNLESHNCDTILVMRLSAGNKFLLPINKSYDNNGNYYYGDSEYEFILFPLHNTFVIDQRIQKMTGDDFWEYDTTCFPTTDLYLGSYCNTLNIYRPPNFPIRRKLLKRKK